MSDKLFEIEPDEPKKELNKRTRQLPPDIVEGINDIGYNPDEVIVDEFGHVEGFREEPRNLTRDSDEDQEPDYIDKARREGIFKEEDYQYLDSYFSEFLLIEEYLATLEERGDKTPMELVQNRNWLKLLLESALKKNLPQHKETLEKFVEYKRKRLG